MSELAGKAKDIKSKAGGFESLARFQSNWAPKTLKSDSRNFAENYKNAIIIILQTSPNNE